MNSPYSSPNPTSESAATGGGNLSNAAQKIKSAASDTADRIKSVAANTADQLKNQAGQMAGETKEDVARRFDTYGSAIHDSAKSMERDDPNIAWVTHQAADRLQGVADYVRNRDFAALRGDVENLARRHPAVFFGSLFVAGIVLGNVLKATATSAAGSRSNNLLLNEDSDGNLSASSERTTENWSGSSQSPSESALSSSAPADI